MLWIIVKAEAANFRAPRVSMLYPRRIVPKSAALQNNIFLHGCEVFFIFASSSCLLSVWQLLVGPPQMEAVTHPSHCTHTCGLDSLRRSGSRILGETQALHFLLCTSVWQVTYRVGFFCLQNRPIYIKVNYSYISMRSGGPHCSATGAYKSPHTIITPNMAAEQCVLKLIMFWKQ